MKRLDALSAHTAPPVRRLCRGFSLIELLVVIAIVAVLATVSIVGFNSINRSGGARGAADVAASMTLSARVEAMSMGLGALLVVDNGNDTNTKLRRLAVFRYVPDPANASGKILELVGRPTTLQPNVFFLRGYSSGFSQTNVNFPGATNTPVLAYRFTGTGHFQPEGSGAQDGARLVFSPGPLNADGSPANPNVIAARAGFLLRKNGRPVFFTSPDQMAQQ